MQLSFDSIIISIRQFESRQQSESMFSLNLAMNDVELITLSLEIDLSDSLRAQKELKRLMRDEKIYEKLVDSIEAQNTNISNAIANYVQIEDHHDSKKCQYIKVSKVLRQNISRHKNNDLNKALKLLTTMKKKKKKNIVIDFCYMHLMKIVDHFELQTRKLNKIEFKHKLNIIYNQKTNLMLLKTNRSTYQ